LLLARENIPTTALHTRASSSHWDSTLQNGRSTCGILILKKKLKLQEYGVEFYTMEYFFVQQRVVCWIIMQVEDGTVAGVVRTAGTKGGWRGAPRYDFQNRTPKKEANSCFMTSAVGSLLF
jgi:hypothetical protein